MMLMTMMLLMMMTMVVEIWDELLRAGLDRA
jgi:hypothetical protein